MKMYKKHIFVFLGVSIFLYGCSNFKATNDIYGQEFQKEKILLKTKSYDELIEQNKQKLKQKDTPQTRLKLASNYYEAKDFKSSIYYLEPLLKDSKNLDALILQAKSLDSLGKYDEALEAINKALELKPSSSDALNIAGVIYAKKRDFKEAKEYFYKAKSFLIDDITINTNLGMLYIMEGKYQDALSYLLPLYLRGSKNEVLMSNLILALVKEQKEKQALDIAEKERITRDPRELIRTLRQSNIEELQSKGSTKIDAIKQTQEADKKINKEEQDMQQEGINKKQEISKSKEANKKSNKKSSKEEKINKKASKEQKIKKGKEVKTSKLRNFKDGFITKQRS